MTVTESPAAQPPVPTTDADRVPTHPALAPHVELIGEFEGTGFAEQQWLVRRDEKFVQLTELLYRIAEHADGSRGLDEIAAAVTDATEWLVTADNVRELIAARLIPLGLIVDSTGRAAVERPRGLTADASQALGLRTRLRVIRSGTIDRFARVLQYLFVPPVLITLLAVAVAAHYWVYRVNGLTGAFIDALYTPTSLLVILGVALAGAVFHEFGHASALRYGGGRARSMGAGLYLIFPAFYTDVTDSYRLGRWGRVRTGLGGPYFHLLFATALIAISAAFGFEFLLLAVVLINVEVLRQFVPFVRLDGYWVLADLTGVPDFFSQLGPFLRSLSPRFGRDGSRLPPLKRWVTVVFGVYIAITVPLLIALLVLLVKFLPRLMIILWDAVATQVNFLRAAASTSQWVDVVTAVFQLALLALPIVGLAFLLYTLIWKPTRAALVQPTPRRRAAALAVVAAGVAVIGFVWFPQLPFAGSPAPSGVKTFEVDARSHTRERVAYAQAPPVGGPHAPIWQNCGFYAAPIAAENGVHSLEHGAVWITYRQDVNARELAKLRSLARDEYVLVSPFPNLRSRVVASAWGRQLTVRSADDARLVRFVDAFRGSGDAPEAGGPCTGGTGTPAP